MKKVNAFCKVLDSLGDEEKDKLLTSAKGLMKAQKAVRPDSAKSKKQKSSAYAGDK